MQIKQICIWFELSMSIQNAHCNNSIDFKCSIGVISQKYGCKQRDDGAAFSSLYSIGHIVILDS